MSVKNSARMENILILKMEVGGGQCIIRDTRLSKISPFPLSLLDVPSPILKQFRGQHLCVGSSLTTDSEYLESCSIFGVSYRPFQIVDMIEAIEDINKADTRMRSCMVGLGIEILAVLYTLQSTF